MEKSFFLVPVSNLIPILRITRERSRTVSIVKEKASKIQIGVGRYLNTKIFFNNFMVNVTTFSI